MIYVFNVTLRRKWDNAENFISNEKISSAELGGRTEANTMNQRSGT